MSAEEYKEALRFEQELKVGDRCRAHWTNCSYGYEVEAEVVAINPKSYGVRTTEANDGYPAGQHLNIPRILNWKKWSWNNRVAPVQKNHYEKHLKVGVMPLTWKDGRLMFPRLHWFIERLKASWCNKRWISPRDFDEICRGN